MDLSYVVISGALEKKTNTYIPHVSTQKGCVTHIPQAVQLNPGFNPKPNHFPMAGNETIDIFLLFAHPLPQYGHCVWPVPHPLLHPPSSLHDSTPVIPFCHSGKGQGGTVGVGTRKKNYFQK